MFIRGAIAAGGRAAAAFSLLLLLVLPAAAPAGAQPLQLRLGAPVNLVIGADGVLPGGGLAPAVNESTVLEWRPDRDISKIIVSTWAPGQSFSLTIEAFDVEGIGTPSSPIALVHGMMPQDLLRNLTRNPPINRSSASIRYTATAPQINGVPVQSGVDIHTVTFTLTEQ